MVNHDIGGRLITAVDRQIGLLPRDFECLRRELATDQPTGQARLATPFQACVAALIAKLGTDHLPSQLGMPILAPCTHQRQGPSSHARLAQ